MDYPGRPGQTPPVGVTTGRARDIVKVADKRARINRRPCTNANWSLNMPILTVQG